MELTTKFQLRRLTIITLTTTAIICFALALVFQYERQQSSTSLITQNKYLAGLAATTTVGFASLLVVGYLGVTSQQLTTTECVQLYNAGIKRYNEELSSLQTQSVGLAEQATATNNLSRTQAATNRLPPIPSTARA